ncbi:MAG TPA: hypothetical protein DDX39_00525 [Bacteroidales bacterium]|nr:MAG: hypothetical protein A2W98_09630 [Bacteroidetes bacterium GWF2_33_38]OFY74774.1 MAG: hypothetical protein A2265_07620 [Bacteroidetes bacterium RIFOXYA12_FULL_33_9]HBF87095.1 hypothetical protein [Bacteroidales bacterium]
MKYFLLAFLSIAVLLNSCKKDDDNDDDNKTTNIMPSKFKVDIPESISSTDLQKSTSDAPLQGNEIYENLRTFIHIGEFSADVVSEIMQAIATHGIDEAMTFSFVSDDDGRTKDVAVTENVSINDVTWEYALLMQDEDGDTAMQILWNRDPVVGIATLNPYDMNRNENEALQNVMYQVEYSEAGDMGYENHMIVQISGWPIVENYSINNLKMFAGKNGTTIDVFGNSNHPIARLVDSTYTEGLNWAFVAQGFTDSDIATAKVALATCNLQDTTNMFEDYSIYSVLNNELHSVYDPYITEWGNDTIQAIFNYYLQNTHAPAYFDETGFVSCGVSNMPSTPSGFSNLSLSGLKPYIPYDIDNLLVKFLE